MARNYAAALKEFQRCLENNSGNKDIRRKMVICLTAQKEGSNALDILLPLMEDDIEYIISKNPAYDDCPCEELIQLFENDPSLSENSSDTALSLAIIWLYCDIRKSRTYFSVAKKYFPKDSRIERIIELINNYDKSSTTLGESQ